MIFWSLFLPLTALFFVLYFHYIDVIFNGRKKPYLIRKREAHSIAPREIYSTIFNLFVFATVGGLVGWLIEEGHSMTYVDTPKSFTDFLLLPICFFLALGIHDFYFYWTHRSLHIKFIFKYVHVPHHKSTEVSAWSAFSFHPIEALIQIGIVVLLALFIPMHISVLIAFSILLFLISVYGHCGYELRINKWEGFNIFNTSFHHYQHHKEVHYNFGIYLNIWDRLFHTGSPNYDHSFKALKTKVNNKLTKSSNAKHPTDDE